MVVLAWEANRMASRREVVAEWNILLKKNWALSSSSQNVQLWEL